MFLERSRKIDENWKSFSRKAEWKVPQGEQAEDTSPVQREELSPLHDPIFNKETTLLRNH